MVSRCEGSLRTMTRWAVEGGCTQTLGGLLALGILVNSEAEPTAALGPRSLISAGVVHLRVQREADVSNLGDLLLYSLDDLEDIAAEKGGICQLLDEKWRKVYKASAPSRLFSTNEMHAA